MLSYNERRGCAGFGRDQFSSDDAFLGGLRNRALDMLRGHQARGEISRLVRYEDLVRRPHDTLTAAFAHLGVDASPPVIRQVLAKDAAASEPRVFIAPAAVKRSTRSADGAVTWHPT